MAFLNLAWGDVLRLEYTVDPSTKEHPFLDSGYRLQAERATANYAFAVIAGYPYEGHKEAMLRRGQAAALQCSVPQRRSFVEKIKAFTG